MALPKTDRGNARFVSEVESRVRSRELGTARLLFEECRSTLWNKGGIDGRTREARIKVMRSSRTTAKKQHS